MFSKILVATDGSEGSLIAARYAAYLASRLESKVTLIHVVEHPAFPFTIAGIPQRERDRIEEEVARGGRSLLRLTQGPLAEAGVAADLELREGRPADVISQFAEEGEFDLIVIGNRGRGNVSRMLLGSVSNEVINIAPCPVLVIKEDHQEPQEGE